MKDGIQVQRIVGPRGSGKSHAAMDSVWKDLIREDDTIYVARGTSDAERCLREVYRRSGCAQTKRDTIVAHDGRVVRFVGPNQNLTSLRISRLILDLPFAAVNQEWLHVILCGSWPEELIVVANDGSGGWTGEQRAWLRFTSTIAWMFDCQELVVCRTNGARTTTSIRVPKKAPLVLRAIRDCVGLNPLEIENLWGRWRRP